MGNVPALPPGGNAGTFKKNKYFHDLLLGLTKSSLQRVEIQYNLGDRPLVKVMF